MNRWQYSFDIGQFLGNTEQGTISREYQVTIFGLIGGREVTDQIVQ